MKMIKLKLKREYVAICVVVLSIFAFFIFGMYSGTRIESYQSKNDEESQIVELLIRFQKAKNNYHLENYLSCLSDTGRFMFAGAVMVSKQELTELLPSFWSNLKSNRLNAVPSSREELNGNYFDGAFYDPVIEINKDKASAVLIFMTPVTKWKTTLFLNFQKDNEGWKITRLEWDMG